MRIQELTNLCSFEYAHSFNLDGLTEKGLFDRLKTTDKHILLLVGPKQPQYKALMRKIRSEHRMRNGYGRARMIFKVKTGHGGDTEFWIVFNPNGRGANEAGGQFKSEI